MYFCCVKLFKLKEGFVLFYETPELTSDVFIQNIILHIIHMQHISLEKLLRMFF
jgi:hypothetical protein